jgi:hypothetical protein
MHTHLEQFLLWLASTNHANANPIGSWVSKILLPCSLLGAAPSCWPRCHEIEPFHVAQPGEVLGISRDQRQAVLPA